MVSQTPVRILFLILDGLDDQFCFTCFLKSMTAAQLCNNEWEMNTYYGTERVFRVLGRSWHILHAVTYSMAKHPTQLFAFSEFCQQWHLPFLSTKTWTRLWKLCQSMGLRPTITQCIQGEWLTDCRLFMCQDENKPEDESFLSLCINLAFDERTDADQALSTMINWRIGSLVMQKFQNERKLWFLSSFSSWQTGYNRLFLSQDENKNEPKDKSFHLFWIIPLTNEPSCKY